MEREKKRKRADHHHHVQVNGGERRRKEESEAEAAAAAAAEETEQAQPTEEEVEEFFSILRRMNVAVRYFEKSGGSVGNVNGDGRKMTALEGTIADGVKIEGASKAGVGRTGLDLNEVPEAES